MDTEDRLAKALEEQNALLRKADRRGGCLWNLILFVLFGVFYLAYLLVKRIVKIVVALARLTWRAIRWASLKTWSGLRWAGTQIMKPFRKEGSST